MYDGIDISANTARISPVRKVRGTSEKKSGIISARIMKSAPIEMNRIRRIVLNGIEVVKSISIPTIPIIAAQIVDISSFGMSKAR